MSIAITNRRHKQNKQLNWNNGRLNVWPPFEIRIEKTPKKKPFMSHIRNNIERKRHTLRNVLVVIFHFALGFFNGLDNSWYFGYFRFTSPCLAFSLSCACEMFEFNYHLTFFSCFITIIGTKMNCIVKCYRIYFIRAYYCMRMKTTINLLFSLTWSLCL